MASLHPQGLPTRPLTRRLSACLSGVLLCLASTTLAAQPEQAPAKGTHLGVMVVMPKHVKQQKRKPETKVKRSLLNFGRDTDKRSRSKKQSATTPHSSKNPTSRTATRPAKKPAIETQVKTREAPSTRPDVPAAKQAPPGTRLQKNIPQPPERTPPSALHIVSPDYPRQAYRKGLSGTVKVRFTIEPNGRTSGVDIVSAHPLGVFDEAARQAVQQWRFNPATVNGRPTATTVTQQLIFNPPPGRRHRKNTPAHEHEKPKKAEAKNEVPANRVPANIQPTHIVSPKYPPEAYRAGRSGSVTVKFTVGTDGRTHNVEIVKARPRRVFDKATRRAVQKWRFKPVDQPTEVVQTIQFTPPG